MFFESTVIEKVFVKWIILAKQKQGSSMSLKVGEI
jgi:hypothetical protein